MATTMATTSPSEKQSVGRSEARILTELAIKSLKHGERRTDGGLPSGNGRLVVSCTKARGRIRRVWTFRYRKAEIHGELMLGEHPALTLEAARVEARRLADLVRGGQDPKLKRAEARRANEAAAREQLALGTLSTLLSSYVAKLRASGKLCAREVERLFDIHVTGPWPALARLPANELRPEDIRDILARLVRMNIKRQTNVVRSYLQAAFTYGAHADLDPRRAADDAALFRLSSNPVALLPRIQEFETTRDRILSDPEFCHVWQQLSFIRVEIGLALRCAILLGGQRFTQLLRVTWKDYDKQAGVLRLSDSKGKRSAALPHYLPVSTRVKELLQELWRFNSTGPFIFSTNGGKKGVHPTSLPGIFADMRQAWRTAGGDANVDFQGRDIRRSIETRLQALGVSREIRAQLLSHGRTSGVQQKHYERHDYLREKAAALDLLEGHLFGIFPNIPLTKSADLVSKVTLAEVTAQVRRSA